MLRLQLPARNQSTAGLAALAAAATGLAGLGVAILRRRRHRRQVKVFNKEEVPEHFRGRTPKGIYDVIVVGAGPAGATAAYFASKAGLRVALLDRKKFPRVKLCGDAWCAPALDILEEMQAPDGGNVLQAMERDGVIKSVKRGGFVSPSGVECISTAEAAYGSVSGCRTYAIKRYDADVYLVRAAAAAGAKLLEEWEVNDCLLQFHSFGGKAWKVSTASGQSVIGRMLFVCDGSTSDLAQKLGIIPEGKAPEAVCSHRYISGSNWSGNKAADGVMLYSRSILPGYSALFRHADGDIYLGTCILPGGKATSRAIAPFEDELMRRHPYARFALGEEPADSNTTASQFTLAPIRLGGLAKSWGPQVFLVGDAAGHVDPLTGEGIHTAMVAAKIAAQVASEIRAADDPRADDHLNGNYEVYHWRCWDAFVADFRYSSWAAVLVYRFPIILDAVCRVGARKGQWFFDFLGEVMTGVRSKAAILFRPLLVAEIMAEVIPACFASQSPGHPGDIGATIVKDGSGRRATT